MIKKLSVYISECLDVYKNLAAEKYLLDSVREDEIILYLWQNEKAVVIGRNQNTYAECSLALAKEQGIKIARRLSGGGAVFHDRGNLNFTFISHKENADTQRNIRIISDACRNVGIRAEISGRNDLLAGGRKFSGNAFYNSGERVYHHGTIMIKSDLDLMQQVLTPSLEKLTAKGVKSVKSRVVNLCELSPCLTCEQMVTQLISAAEEYLGIKSERAARIDEGLLCEAASLYGSSDYIFSKSPLFSFSAKDRFDWGCIEIMLQIKNGIITEAAAYTDSLVWQTADLVRCALTGTAFSYEAVLSRLSHTLDERVCRDIADLILGTNK